jgi:hypothetical protein
MSGPIVRTGATPEFWKNWDKVFGGATGSGNRKTSSGTAPQSARAGKKGAKSSATPAAAGKSTATKSTAAKAKKASAKGAVKKKGAKKGVKKSASKPRATKK